MALFSGTFTRYLVSCLIHMNSQLLIQRRRFVLKIGDRELKFSVEGHEQGFPSPAPSAPKTLFFNFSHEKHIWSQQFQHYFEQQASVKI